jgi:hypothetical protein
MEVWKPINGYEGCYEVSTFGRVKSLDRYDSMKRFKIGRILKPRKNQGGYLNVQISNGVVIKNTAIHRIVALTFILNPNNYPEVNHKDGNKQNNHISNLEWCTRSQNEKHAYRSGLKKAPKEKKNTKLTQKDADLIRWLNLQCKISQKNISKIFPVSQCHISRIIGNFSW